MQLIFLRLFFSIFFSLAAYHASFAQKDKVHYINDMVEYVKENIKGNEYDLFTGEGSGKLSIPALNTLKGNETFYYSYVGLEEPVLRMVVVKGENEKQKYYAEYLYDNERNLIYFFEENKTDKASAFTKMKTYFEKEDQLIEMWQDDKVYNSIMIQESKKIKSILQDSKTYLELFDKHFENEPD